MRPYLPALAALALAGCASTPTTTAAPVTPVAASAANTPAPGAGVTASPMTAAPARDTRADARAADERRRRDAEIAAARATLASVLYFDYDEDALRPETTVLLEQMAGVLQRYPALAVRLVGNADDRGSDEYNLALGQRRAAAAKRWLVDHGIPQQRVEIVSFGREKPVCTEDTEACWRRNRRDEVVVVRGGDALATSTP